MPLTSTQWKQVESLFSLAMQLPPEHRYGWRHRTEPVDVLVADEVDALIVTCDDGARHALPDAPGPIVRIGQAGAWGPRY